MQFEQACKHCKSRWYGEESIVKKATCPFCGEALEGEKGVIGLGTKFLSLDNDEWLIENGTLKAYRGNGGRVTVPQGVIAIEADALKLPNTNAIKEISLPDSLQTLGKRALAGCTAVNALVLPEGLKSIGENAFVGMPLSSIVVPDSVTDIQDYAFGGCAATEIRLPKNFSRLGKIFAGAMALKEAVIPDGVTEITTGAFESCHALEFIDIPASVKKICRQAFTSIGESKQNLVLYIPETVTEIEAGGIPVVLAYLLCGAKEQPARWANFSVSSNKIEWNIDSNGCRIVDGRLTGVFFVRNGEIVIPEGVTEIAESCYMHLGERGPNHAKAIRLPSSLKTIGAESMGWLHHIEEISIPDGVTSIGLNAFRYCGRLQKVYIPQSVTEMDQAFLTFSKFLTVTVATKAQTRKWKWGWSKVTDGMTAKVVYLAKK